MKKVLTIVLGASLIVSSCTTNQAASVYTGSMFGDVLGSAIGGLVGGWRGHELGSIIGTVSGAAVGAAVAAQSERNQERRVQQHAQARRQRMAQQRSRGADDSYYPGQNGAAYDGQGAADQSGFDPQMRGDDRITMSPSDGASAPANGAYHVPSTPAVAAGQSLIIRNAGVYEDQRDGVLTRGETCQVVFEITNVSDQPVYDVFPLVEEVTGCRYVHISPNLRVESIAPHQSIRYTASLHADNRLRNGTIEVRVGVAQGNHRIDSQTRQFSVPTARRAR